MTSAFEDRVAALARSGGNVTLEQLGGLEDIPAESTTSPIFPLVADAIVQAYSSGGRMPDKAAELVVDAVANANSGVALADICASVVPVAPAAGIATRLKEALRVRTIPRATSAEAGMAALALQALCHLAVLDDSARPALLDVLTAVASGDAEDSAFAVAAARVAGVAFDHWRDPTAVQCLERLTDTEAEADAWFALGHARLVEALQHTHTGDIAAGVRDAIEPFARAVEQGEDRADARMYLGVVLFVSAWAEGSPAAELQQHLDRAGEALTAFWFEGLGLPERYGWYRPRFEAEVRWLDVLRLMRSVALAEDRDAWYRPPMVLGALAEALEAARTLRPARTARLDQPSHADELVEPRLATPFLREVAFLGWLDQWLRENPGPTADRLDAAIRRRLEGSVTRGKAPAEGLSALSELLGTEALDDEPDEVLLRLNQVLLDRQSVERARRLRVVDEALRGVVGALVPCADFVGEVRDRFESLVEKVVLFLHSRMNVEKGGAAGRFAYLFDAGALEVELARDLKSWLEGNYPGSVLAEVREIGGGRTDLIVQFDAFRLVMELKRELDDASRGGLGGYLPQVAAYESTDVALGMLVVLDLTPKPTAPANLRDNVWVDVVEGPSAGDRPRFVVAVRVPGNRESPSAL